MADPLYNASKLDAGQVLQHSFDEATQRIRVDSEATIVNATIDVSLDPLDDGVYLGDQDGNLLVINPDGSINVQVEGLPAGLATEAAQDVGNTSLDSIDTKIPAQIGGRLPVDIGVSPLTDTQLRASPINVTETNPITGFATETTLLNIEAALLAPLSITQPLITAGTIDGTVVGTQFINVNNLRQQILASHDREQDITYADFGTKDQRITQVDYNSTTFPSNTARKTITYTLVSGRYRRDSINWSLV
jgi:hypothetical protein